jgi:hypothetical protein
VVRDPNYIAVVAVVLAIFAAAGVPTTADTRPPSSVPAAAYHPGQPVIEKQPAAKHWPDHADPKHVDSEEPPEFAAAPFLGQQRPVRAWFLPPRRGWVGRSTLAWGYRSPATG